MNVENQNSAGTTSALAQKTGIKPLSKIIAGVGAAIVALVALCSIFGDSESAGVAAVKNSVWKFDPTVTLEEAIEKREPRQGDYYFEDPKEFQEKGWPFTQEHDAKAIFDKGVDSGKSVFKTNCGQEEEMILRTLEKAFTKKRKAEWIDGGETSTGVRSVTLKLFDEGKQWIRFPYANSKLKEQALAATTNGCYLVEAKVDVVEIPFLVYPDGNIEVKDMQKLKWYVY